ncbi:Acg family FMN-binding oxidoreductase [Nocardia sp. NPDC127526]|uniref:Acg family FMN-binding oxidoreductase n=1 Tax=Nocardia sp. NPDC127526 TaxID=3345393 RepID=UPI00362D2E45
MTGTDTHTAATVPDHASLAEAIRVAGRAPSIHNTQPWRWVFDGDRLHLYGDTDRQLFATDPHGREWVISCGAMLHHARTVFAARGWRTETVRLPDPQRPDHLATLIFRPWPQPPADAATLVRAIEDRYTDRLPLREPPRWNNLVIDLRRLVAAHDLTLDVLVDNARTQLTAASRRATEARRYDSMYQDELDWWAGHPDTPEGVPPTALASTAEQAHVGVARAFPVVSHSARRADLQDEAGLVVLGSPSGDTVARWLHTGEALSAVLLECTARGLATCTLTHVTELPAARRAVADLIPHRTTPQVVIRIGVAPDGERPPRTPRRPLADILTVEV